MVNARGTIQIKDRHISYSSAVVNAFSHRTNGFINNNAAVTIAAAFQSPTGMGFVMAGFASGMEVDSDELIADITNTIENEKMLNSDDLVALQQLIQFVAYKTKWTEV